MGMQRISNKEIIREIGSSNGGGGHSYFLSRPAASHVGPWNPLEHRHWNLVPFGTQLPPFLHGAPAQGSGVLCEGGAAPKCKIQAKYI